MEEDGKEFSLQILFSSAALLLFITLNHLTSGIIYTCRIKCDNCTAESALQIYFLLSNSILLIDDLQLVLICALVDVGGVPTSPQSSYIVTGKPMVNISAKLQHFMMVPQE